MSDEVDPCEEIKKDIMSEVRSYYALMYNLKMEESAEDKKIWREEANRSYSAIEQWIEDYAKCRYRAIKFQSLMNISSQYLKGHMRRLTTHSVSFL